MTLTTNEVCIRLLGGDPVSGPADEPTKWCINFQLTPVPNNYWQKSFKRIAENEFENPRFTQDPDARSGEEPSDTPNELDLQFAPETDGSLNVYCDSDEIEFISKVLRTATNKANVAYIRHIEADEDERVYVLSVQRRIEELKTRFNSGQ